MLTKGQWYGGWFDFLCDVSLNDQLNRVASDEMEKPRTTFTYFINTLESCSYTWPALEVLTRAFICDQVSYTGMFFASSPIQGLLGVRYTKYHDTL